VSVHKLNIYADSDSAEILPIVDENDTVVGRGRRDIVHRFGFRHRAIHALVFNYSGEIFLQKRGLHKDNDPGLWDSSVAGHVDYGESYDDCCIREMAEEIGIHITQVPSKLFKLGAGKVTGMEFSWVYRLITNDLLKPNYLEMERGEWYSVTMVDYMTQNKHSLVSDTFREVWKHYRVGGYDK